MSDERAEQPGPQPTSPQVQSDQVQSDQVQAREALARQALLALPADRYRDQPVGVIYGGQSAERDISLRTGLALLEALREAGYDQARGYDWPADQAAFIQAPPAAALLAMHSGVGEDGTLQGFLEILGVPYTGSGVLGTALAMDKARAKAVMASAGVPLARGAFLGSGALELQQARASIAQADLSMPLIFKPNDSGSSCGVRVCADEHALAQALTELEQLRAQGQASGALVEEVLSGPEYSVGFFDELCLGAIQISPAQGLYDYQAKYLSQTTRYEDVRDERALELERVARDAWRALGCRGVGRVDVMAHHDGQLRVLEVNTIPGMTATSLVPKLARRHGVEFSRLAALMISAATTDAAWRLAVAAKRPG